MDLVVFIVRQTNVLSVNNRQRYVNNFSSYRVIQFYNLNPGCYLNIQMCLNPMFHTQNHNLEILNNNFTNNKLTEGTDCKHAKMTHLRVRTVTVGHNLLCCWK